MSSSPFADTLTSTPSRPPSPSTKSTSSSAHANPVSAFKYLAEKLRNARDALVAKGLYLGTGGIANEVKWAPVGHGHLLVTTETAEMIQHAQDDHAADPDANPMPDVSPAILSAVVLITEEDFWMTSCGMWKGPTAITPTFADVKPTCTGGSPDHELFANDFRTVCGNVNTVMNMGRTPGFKNIKGVKVGTANGLNPKLKFRHVLFEVSDIPYFESQHLLIVHISALMIHPMTLPDLMFLRTIILTVCPQTCVKNPT